MSIFDLLTPIVAASLMYLVRAVYEKISRRPRETKVEEAERQVYKFLPPDLLEKIDKLVSSQENLTEKAKDLTSIIDQNKQALLLGDLFNLYNTQIERYQDETRSRASWSFYIALIAMFSGFAFVVWGGQYILTQTNWDHVAAGSALAAIGGSVSAYITKTFLDVHRLSLQQLNRYFDQPVINDHVLMAQRLADNIQDQSARQRSYESIISSLTTLVNTHGQTDSKSANNITTKATKLADETANAS